MKKYFLSRGNLSADYRLDQGSFGSHRYNLGALSEEALYEYIVKNVNLKRKSEFYIETEKISKNVIGRLENKFKKTKVFLKKIRNLQTFFS